MTNSNVFYRKLNHFYPTITHGQGCWLYDDSGKKYLDAVGGAFVANIGHGVAEIAEVIGEQARRVAYVNGTAFTNEPAELLAKEIADFCPPDLNKVYFLSSGSEAVEAALKMARQYWLAKGAHQKHKIIARKPGYHGNTLLALSASSRGHYRAPFQPWITEVATIPAPYSYRCSCDNLDPSCPACSGQALEETILREGPANVAAFIAETVGGSSTGASVPRPDYYQRIREICDRYQILLIADEVLVGCGRTGTWTAMEPYQTTPDILILGKGLSGGYVPLSAIVTSERIVQTLAQSSEQGLMHAQTFSHHPVACAAGLATVRYLKKRDLVNRCAVMGKRFHEKLETLKKISIVGDVRGRGLLAGIEFVEDQTTRRPFDRQINVAERVTKAAQQSGLIVWPNVGHADGTNGDLIMIAPPFIITEEEIDDMINRLNQSMAQITQEVSQLCLR